MKCFAGDPVIQDQEQGSHALEPQWRTLQIGNAVQKKLDLLRRDYACLKMSFYSLHGQHLVRHKPFGVDRLRYKQNCRTAIRSLLLVSGCRSGSGLIQKRSPPATIDADLKLRTSQTYEVEAPAIQM